jgi:tetratricopeptide (TPR) repeat protein
VAQAYRDRGDKVQAASVFEEVAQIAYDNSDAQYHAGNTFSKVLYILTLYSKYTRALTFGEFLVGMAHLQAGALEQAQKRWEECVKLDPDHLTAKFNLATLLAERGNLEGATEMMQRVIAQQVKF